MLTIPEELLLLQGAAFRTTAVRPKRSEYTLASKPVAAACLVELVLAGRVTVETQRRYLLAHDDVMVTDATPTGDPLLDDVLVRVAAAKRRSCTYWIERLAKWSENECWDRLIAKSLIRPDPPHYAANSDAVAALTERIRAVLAESGATQVRDAALVGLLANTQSLFGLLHDSVTLTPAGVVRGYRAQRSVDRDGRQALERTVRTSDASIGSDVDESHARSAQAAAIDRIVRAAASLKGSGPG